MTDEEKINERKFPESKKPRLMTPEVARPFQPTDFHHKEINDRLYKLEKNVQSILDILNEHINSEYAHQR